MNNAKGGTEYTEPQRLLLGYLALAGRQALGWALVVLGGIVVLIGWLGLSTEVVVARQIPYLMSAGVGGLFLLGLGGLLLVSHELRLDNRRLARLESMVEDLHAVLVQTDQDSMGPLASTKHLEVTNGASERRTVRENVRREATNDDVVLVVPRTKTFHEPGCALAEGKAGVRKVKPETALARGLSACRVCDPQREHVSPGTSVSTAPSGK